MPLSQTKSGKRVNCSMCGKEKAPMGRSVSAYTAANYCHPYGDCDGYALQPYMGSLWPGETEAEFGYMVGTRGTTEEAPLMNQSSTRRRK